MIQALASLLFLLSVLAYAVPSVIAILRTPKRWPLAVAINVLLGWTIVGWLVAFAMALELRLPKRRRPKPRPKQAPVAKLPAARSEPPGKPVREHAEPPPVQEEAYAQWLDGGAAMGA